MKIGVYKTFSKEQKRLQKRYKNINKDILKLIDELEKNPFLGTDLGNGLRKVRMKISDKGKGKRAGARVITLFTMLADNDSELGLVYLYDKSERTNILVPEIMDIIKSNIEKM